MNDEASVTARAVRAQLKEGRDWLKETLNYVPKYSWQIDPFGHSSGQAVVLKEFGYEGMPIQRVHYHLKKQLAKSNQLEFMWHGMKTHLMPFTRTTDLIRVDRTRSYAASLILRACTVTAAVHGVRDPSPSRIETFRNAPPLARPGVQESHAL